MFGAPACRGVARGLVADMSGRVRDHVAPAMEGATGAIDAEACALAAFLQFAREHQEIYRIVDETEFVDPERFRTHYASTADRIAARLAAGAEAGDLRPGLGEVEAWAIMGMNAFLGLRYGVWDTEGDIAAIAARANSLIADGIKWG